MKLVSFRHGTRDGFGVIVGDRIAELGSAAVPTLRAALATLGLEELHVLAAHAEPTIPLDHVEFLQPITDPAKILCVGFNFRAHLAEMGTPIPDHPAWFVRFPESQVGHLQPIVRPRTSTCYDFEGELAVIIGTGGRHIPRETALDHVAGYSCFAENSLRDWQRHSTQATPGKNFERSGAFGPWMVTADDLPEIAEMTLVTRLNGAQMQRTSLDDFIFPIPDLIAYVSTFTTLHPGDVIATGTPAGVGMGRKPPLWMKAGDVLEVEISGIGTLRNTVIDE